MAEHHAVRGKHIKKSEQKNAKFSFRRGMAAAALVGLVGSWTLGSLAKEYYLDYGDIIVDNDTVYYSDENGEQVDGYEDHQGEIVITQITEEAVTNTLTIISGEELDIGDTAEAAEEILEENTVEAVPEMIPEETVSEPTADAEESAEEENATEPVSEADTPSEEENAVDTTEPGGADPTGTENTEPAVEPENAPTVTENAVPEEEPGENEPTEPENEEEPAEPETDAPDTEPNNSTLPAEEPPAESTAAPEKEENSLSPCEEESAAAQPMTQETSQPVESDDEENGEETTEPEEKKTVTVTIKDINIDVSGITYPSEDIWGLLGDVGDPRESNKVDAKHDTAAITIKGDGDVVLELAGENAVAGGGSGWKSGIDYQYSNHGAQAVLNIVPIGSHAGVEKNDNVSSGTLIIQDKEGDGEIGSLTAQGGKNIELSLNMDDQGMSNYWAQGWGGAGIGSSGMESTSNIHIKSGIINATGGQGAAGIGSGGTKKWYENPNNVKNILISGGDITATAGVGTDPEWKASWCVGDRYHCATSGAGIGSGNGGNVDGITITGGNIKATGMNGGAGIGGGSEFWNDVTVKNIKITGGTIEASAKGQLPEAEELNIRGYEEGDNGYDIDDYNWHLGAGIGGGYGNTVEDITIAGGAVTAASKLQGAGIGSAGDYGSVKNITISGGTIEASSKDGSGIGAGGWFGNSAQNILIKGGTVSTTGGFGWAGIGADNIVIEDGIVTASVTRCPYLLGGEVEAWWEEYFYQGVRNCYGAAIGGGIDSKDGSITIKGGTVTANGYEEQTNNLTGVDANFLEKGQNTGTKFGQIGGFTTQLDETTISMNYELTWEGGAIVRESTEEQKTCSHEWGESYVDVEATCEVRGLLAQDCTKCGAVRRTLIPKACIWDEGSVTTEPTCVERGVKTYTCTVCGNTKTEDLGLADHAWGEQEVLTKPTCTQKGEEGRTCTVCGAKDESSVQELPATGHKLTRSEVTTAPTCTTAGVLTHFCTNEGCDYTETEPIAPLTHDWSDWMVSKPATVLEEGEEIRVCRHDASHVETRPIAKLAPIEESNSADSLLLRVDTLDGVNLLYRQEMQGDCIVITAPENEENAVLYGPLGCLEELEADGAKTLVFRTKNFESRVSIRAIFSSGTQEDTFALTHKNQQACLVVAGRWAGELVFEVSARNG